MWNNCDRIASDNGFILSSLSPALRRYCSCKVLPVNPFLFYPIETEWPATIGAIWTGRVVLRMLGFITVDPIFNSEVHSLLLWRGCRRGFNRFVSGGEDVR